MGGNDVDHILSVCSGIGGLDLGLSAGLRAVGRSPRTVCMVEGEAFAVACLGKAMQEGRMDDCPVWCGDLRELRAGELPRVDWISGGYPCQPFSVSGQRQGKDDRRHLWPVIERLVRTVRPRGVFFENVAGHLTLGLRDVLADLERLGFRCAFGLYTAEEVGAPHRRERVFILGLADAGLHDEATRGECEAAAEGSGGGDGQSGSGCDDRQGYREASREVAELGDSVCSRWREIDGKINPGPLSDSRGFSGIRWPSRPGLEKYSWEPSRTVPSLGRNADGLPDRVDRLRALGNAVVPAQAELAFVRLWNLLTGGRA